MICELFNNKLYKKTLIHMALSVFIVFSLYSIVFKTLYVYSISNVAFQIPIFVDLIPHVTPMTEIIGILIAYAYITYAFYRFSNKRANFFAVIFALLIVYKYLVTIAITYVPVFVTRANSNIDVVISDMLVDILLSVAFPLMLEIVQLIVVVLFAKRFTNKALEFIKEKKALEGKLPNYHFDEHEVFFPFVKLFNTKNPLQKIALWHSIVIAFSKIIQFIIIDINIGFTTNIATDLLWMAWAYTSCVILGLISYLFIIFVLINLNSKEMKLKYK